MREQILAVQQMQEYIETHLGEEITLNALADAARFSPWHAYRLFREHTGLTVSKYIRRLRLSRSAVLLKKGNCTVTDAAMMLGFGSVDGYTRAFTREFGCLPHEYAAHPLPITLFIPYGVKFIEMRKECSVMDNVQSVFVQVLHKPARKVVLKRASSAASDYFSYCEEVGCDVWGLLLSMDSLCGEPVCLWLPEKHRPVGTSEYVMGVEAGLETNIPVPDGFDVIELPECDYLSFQGEPFAEEEYVQAITAVQHAIDRYDPSMIGYAWDAENPRIQLEPRGERGYIELCAIHKK